IMRPLVEQLPMPVGAGGQIRSTQHEGRPMSSGGPILHPARSNLRSVRQRRVLGQVEGPGDQRGIELVNIAVVAKAGGTRLLVRDGFAERYITGGPDLA